MKCQPFKKVSSPEKLYGCTKTRSTEQSSQDYFVSSEQPETFGLKKFEITRSLKRPQENFCLTTWGRSL